MNYKDVKQCVEELEERKSMVKVTVLGVGHAGLSAIHHMNDLVFSGRTCQAVQFTGLTHNESFHELDMLIILSNIEDDGVASDVLSVAESSKQQGVLTLLVYAGDFAMLDTEQLLPIRLDRLRKSIASTIIIKPQCLYLSARDTSPVSTAYARNQAYRQAVFALASPLVSYGYILNDLYHYHDVFAPDDSRFGNICLFAAGCATGEHRAQHAVESVIKVLSAFSLETNSAHAFVSVMTGDEQTLSMKDYEQTMEMIYPLVNEDCYMLSSITFIEGKKPDLLFYALVCFHSALENKDA
jgi:cell division GTPase FtsZ